MSGCLKNITIYDMTAMIINSKFNVNLLQTDLLVIMTIYISFNGTMAVRHVAYSVQRLHLTCWCC